MRRSGDLIGRITRNLEVAEAIGRFSPKSFPAFFRAHYEPFIEYAISEDKGERHYVRLLVQAQNFWENNATKIVAKEMYVSTQRLISIAARCFPKASGDDLRVIIYLASAAISHLLQDQSLLTVISAGKFNAQNVDQLFDIAEAFFCSGIGKFVSR